MQPYVWILWDLAAVAIFALCVYVCARRGLLRTLISFFSYVIAAVVARLFSPALAKALYDNIVRGILETVVTESVESALAEGLTVLDTVPQSLLRIAESFFGADFADQALAMVDTNLLVDTVIDSALKDPVMLLLQWAAFLVIFSLALFVLQRLARLLNGFYRMPVLGTVNTFLGGVVGILQGILYLMVGGVIINVIIVLGGNDLWWLNSRVMDATYIWRVFLKLTGFFS